VLENFCSHHANVRAAFEFFFDGKSLETFSGRKRTFALRTAGPPKFLADLLWLALEGTQVLFDQLPNPNTKNLGSLAIRFQKVAIDRDRGCFVGVHGAPILPLTLFGQEKITCGNCVIISYERL
jgi:hypothetical protein